jgi:hypothetical protein
MCAEDESSAITDNQIWKTTRKLVIFDKWSTDVDRVWYQILKFFGTFEQISQPIKHTNTVTATYDPLNTEAVCVYSV